jgi:hypothetical protein
LRYKDAIELLLDHITLNNFTVKSLAQLSYDSELFAYVINLLNRNQNYMSAIIVTTILYKIPSLFSSNKSFLISKLNCYYCIMMNIPKDIIFIICTYYLNIIRNLYPVFGICVIQDNGGVSYLPKSSLPYY